jgi:soluble lytic murein transglycosylase-like protein
MLGLFTFALAVATADPRPDLVELQLAGQQQQALVRVEQELALSSEGSRRIGIAYLRGHLLDGLRRYEEAAEAFVRAMAAVPALQSYSRYRVALAQDRMGHPEVAAGLVATVVAGDPRSPLVPEAVWLLDHALAEGGDCKLLSQLRAESLPRPQRRQIDLMRAECALRNRYPELARGLLVSLIQEDSDDEPARRAAERLATLISEGEHGRVPMLIGFTLERHDDFDRALPMLQRALGKGNALSARDTFETQFRIGLTLLGEQRFAEASMVFARLASLARTPDDRARAFYHEARAHELRGAWPAAGQKFRQAYLSQPQGASWAASALLSALRIDWRTGSESTALPLYDKLVAVPNWRKEAARAALFLAASELVRGRGNRAAGWLAQARLGESDDRLEADYWSGRLAELEKRERDAVALYLKVLRADPYHPLSTAARVRLAGDALSRTALAEGRRLAASGQRDNVYSGWLLLAIDPAAQAASQRKLESLLLADRGTAVYLRLAQVPVRRWPLWSQTLTRPPELLLALGAWQPGAPAVRAHFPAADPPLAFTGAVLLARGGEIAESIALTRELLRRAPSPVPLELLPREVRRTLHPMPYRAVILAQEQIRGVDSNLLAALIREESQFDPALLAPASGRGLTRLSMSTARLLAAQLRLERLTADDLFRPEVAIALGAAHLGALLKDFGGSMVPALAGYRAGEPEAMAWRSLCFSREPEELFTKIGTADARDYVRRVLASQGQYAAIY